jgi:hypothetical protein
MDSCFHGVYLDPASPTSLLGTQGYFGINPASSISWDNKWTNNVDTLKVDGATWQQQIIRWVYDQSLGINSDWSPEPGAGFVFEIPGDLHESCIIPQGPPDPKERNLLYGPAVGDSTLTDGYDSEEFILSDKQSFYKQAKHDPGILNQGTPDDVVFQAEYDSLKQTNTGKLDEVTDSLVTNNKTSANQLLSGIQTASQYEDNAKFANLILASEYDPFFDRDRDTIDLLTFIAGQHPFYGGESVFSARAILHTDVFDQLPLLRRSREVTSSETEKENLYKGKLFPNPSGDEVTFIFQKSKEGLYYLKVFDIYGSLLALYNLPQSELKINLTGLNQGVYYFSLFENNVPVEIHKLSIVR